MTAYDIERDIQETCHEVLRRLSNHFDAHTNRRERELIKIAVRLTLQLVEEQVCQLSSEAKEH